MDIRMVRASGLRYATSADECDKRLSLHPWWVRNLLLIVRPTYAFQLSTKGNPIVATDTNPNPGTAANRAEGEVVRVDVGKPDDTVIAHMTGKQTGESGIAMDPEEWEGAADDLNDAVDGGALSGAVGGEKGAVAATMAGETVRGSIAREKYVEPNSPEAAAEEYES
jgi:hypothetical protein